MERTEEEKIRELVRKELEAKELLRGQKLKDLKARQAGGLSEDRLRIIEEEIRTFYLSKGNYKPYENEDGDIEWLSDEEIKEREKQVPVDMEELEAGQNRIRVRIVAIIALFFVALALVLFSMRTQRGSVQVICNIPGATIYLDGSPTEFLTDYKLKDISAGTHIISVSKPGFAIDGDSNARILIESGKESIVAFKLKVE